MSDVSTAISVRAAPSSREFEMMAALGLLALFTLWPSIHLLDLWVQMRFFDIQAGQWLLPPSDRGAFYWLLYRGPKLLLAVSAGLVLFRLAERAVMRRWHEVDTKLFLALCVVGLLPLMVGFLKSLTGVSCPVQETLFAGFHLHVAIWDRLSGILPYNDNLGCWPAGHASAGFGLLGLRLLVPPGSRLYWRYWAPGIGAGWAMGIYQMARGQHYLSHTMVTMALAILLSSLLVAILDRIAHRG